MQHYAEQLILFAKSTSSTNGHIHLPTVPNGHAHPSPSEQHQHQHHHHHHHQPIPPPTPASTSSSSIATSTTSQSGSNSSGSSSNRTITNVPPPQPQSQTQPPPGLGPSPHLDTQTHRVSPTSPFHSSTTGPARPLDALGGVPAPVHNPTAHPAYLLHTHPPHSHQHVHPAGYAQTALADQPHLQAAFAQVPLQQLGLQQMHGMLHHHHHHHHEQQQQQQQRGPSHLRSQSYPALGVPLHRVHPHADPNEQRTPGSEPLATSSSSIINPSVSSSSNSTNSFSEPEHDAEDDDADTSTDAGTETSTDEEPTIRAPRTVTGSVWGDADAEVEREEEDARMRSP
ncbi:hypothetical protein BDZ97DRAFT_686474 [Flammula alnicola]|nr:hypothetical protein BDZ97DRAFT_686474 [Flammula alnicola]